ncbi:hypothetical protein CORC01_01048 [Colletotrichum orchidophilum]|uniref:Uncharacterized protein n=1 Tax=Colletotrichum orchidophilum TaxID=1209926 RepID=A0A1G4BQL0_9PEZI|nr:uncharacterized protein CORC01_01048 [Colletotrichum orchidophilum]OHF03729.1 hypothetical protein CORC01_01048 [Colletotrichum orchidophilum]
MVSSLGTLLVSTGLFSTGVLSQDNLALSSGYKTLTTKNFNFQPVKNAQVQASLKSAGDTFDFLPPGLPLPPLRPRRDADLGMATFGVVVTGSVSVTMGTLSVSIASRQRMWLVGASFGEQCDASDWAGVVIVVSK